MANKINSNSFFNRPEDDTANIALNLANQTFSISTALQSQFNSFGGKFSDFQLDFEDSENFVQDSFLDLQESFDKLSDTVKILSDDMSSLTDKFLLMEQKRADQLKEESIRIFEEQDAAQKRKKAIKAGSLLPGLGGGGGGGDSQDASPGKGGLGGLLTALGLGVFGGPLLKKLLPGLGGSLGKKLLGKGATKGATKVATKKVAQEGLEVGAKKVAQEGLEVGAKKGTQAVTKKVAQEGGEQLVKAGVKTGVKKGLGKSVLKKLPGIGLLMGAGFAAHRAMKGDWSGAGLELASGAASTIPGLGTAASLAIDAGLVAKDVGVFGGGDSKKVDPDKLMNNRSIVESSEATIQKGKVVSGDMSQADADKNKQTLKLQKKLKDASRNHGFNSPEYNEIQKKIYDLQGTPEEAIYTDEKGHLQTKGFSTYGGKTTVSDEKESKGTSLFGRLFGKKSAVAEQGKVVSGDMSQKQVDSSKQRLELEKRKNQVEKIHGRDSDQYKSIESQITSLESNRDVNPILNRISNIENKIGIQANKTDTIGDKDFVKEITAPPPNQDVLDAIEIAGTNTSSEQEEREPIPDTIASTTPTSGTDCAIGCVNVLKLNSVDNLNIRSSM